MNKAVLIECILAQLHIDLAKQTAAAHLARDEAISEESRAESKYDTHSQEAAYLAEAQARLASEIQDSIGFYRGFQLPVFAVGDPIAVGALVELANPGPSDWFLIGPRGGGLELSTGGHNVLVLTPASPIGRLLLGKREGQSISVANGRNTIHREIKTVR